MLIGNPKFEWRRAPVGMKLLGALCVLAWGGVAAPFLIAQWIENNAWNQPATAEGLYTRCYHFKGAIRCLTEHVDTLILRSA